jgi:signal transduction histidine kinase
MKQPAERSEDLATLRHKAEARLRKITLRQQQSHADGDLHKQLHELQVGQIELELQNAQLIELQQARKEIEAGLARYTDLYDFAPVGCFTVGRDSSLREVNLNGASLIGLERTKLVGQLLRTFVAPKYRSIFCVFLAKVFANRAKQSCEIELINAAKRPFFAHIEASTDESGQKCFAVVKDITAHRILSEALRTAREELEAKVQQRTVELVLANEQLKAEIAERKRTEDALKQTKEMLRELAAHQERIKEEERKRIAREIHDDLGQNLLALRIDVSLLHARTGNNHPKLKKRASEALKHIDLTMKSVRAIINNLRPEVLDLGLAAAIEWQVRQFQQRSKIACVLVMNEKDFSCDLDDSLALGLFRVLQESLSNVARHAHATQASIELRCDGCSLKLKVTDNGVGIVPERRRKTASFGLIGMAERVGMLGGEMHIQTGDGSGTALTVSIPVNAKETAH